MASIFKVRFTQVGGPDTSKGAGGGKYRVPNSEQVRLVYSADDTTATAETNLRAALSALHGHTLEVTSIELVEFNVI